MAYTFKGGIHFKENKYTSDCKVEVIPQPPIVKISMDQNTGAPSVPVVKVGDYVRVGQLIGDVPSEDKGCPVHASVSGTVTAIEETCLENGAVVKAVVIENDGKDEASDTVTPYTESIRNLTPDDITERIRLAGIAGSEKDPLPVYAKISSARGKAECLIVNCVECEPFVTSDRGLLTTRPDEVIKGVKILMRAVCAPQAYIAVGKNNKNAISALRGALGDDKLISVKVVKAKYPQGDERQLISTLKGRELSEGNSASDAGCVIFGAEVCAAVYTAFAKGMPYVRRTVTVSGDCVRTPKNLSVPVGAPASFLVECCGGLVRSPARLISGGPMTGQAQTDLDIPVKKSTFALVLLSSSHSKKSSLPASCIRCGRCVANCPMRLMPTYIAKLVQKGDMDGAEHNGAMSCVECGLCSYSCPGKVDVLQYIREAKDHIRAKSREDV